MERPEVWKGSLAMMANEMMRMNNWLDDPFFNELGRRFFGSLSDGTASETGLATDIKENDQAYIAKVDVPGLDKKDIHLNYEDNVLSISVSHDDAADHEDHEGNMLMQERRAVAMNRSFALPNVDSSKISAAYADGVLTITLPKLTADQTDHHIDIQ